MSTTPKFATMNIVGPDGELVKVCDPIPRKWDADLVASMEKTGGVGSKKQADDAFVASLAGIDAHTEAVLHALNAAHGKAEGRR